MPRNRYLGSDWSDGGYGRALFSRECNWRSTHANGYRVEFGLFFDHRFWSGRAGLSACLRPNPLVA